MIFVNPKDIKELGRNPGKRSKTLTWMINTPVFGTFLYNMLVKEDHIESQFRKEYFFHPENVTSEMIKTYYESSSFRRGQSANIFCPARWDITPL